MSRSDGGALLALAESIADGSDVDWEAAEAGAPPDERVVIQQLRILSNLAGLHRSGPRRIGSPGPTFLAACFSSTCSSARAATAACASSPPSRNPSPWRKSFGTSGSA